MASQDAIRDGNHVPSLLLESSTNAGVTVRAKGNESTGALIVEGTSGIGDVDGPASATDNAIARFDGTTGKLIQNSTITLSDTSGTFTQNTVNGNIILSPNGTGGVGVGTASPQAKLEVATTVSGEIARFSSSGSSGGYISLYDNLNSTLRGYLSYGASGHSGAIISDVFLNSGGKLGFSTGGDNERMTIVSTGNVLFGTTTDSSNGRIQLATHTVNTGGIGFGTDTSLWRSAAGILRFGDTGSDNAQFVLNGNGGAGLAIIQAGTVGTINANRSTGSLILQTNSTTVATFLATNTSGSGQIQFATGSSSTAGAISFAFGGGTISNTSGSHTSFYLNPTYNQASGTAANTDFLINRTQTAVGSGTQLLIDAQVSTVSKFSVTSAGYISGAQGMQAPEVRMASQIRLMPTADGVLAIYNNASTDFGRLQFGGTTSSFPSIKRSGTGLQIRLADDSGVASLVTGTLQVQSSAGTIDVSGTQLQLGSGASTTSVQLNAVSGNAILTFGGSTSSFPSIKRSSAILALRLADDSADAGFSASSAVLSGKVTTYNNIATTGGGVPAIYASYSTTGNTAAVTNAINYTPPATAGRYRLSWTVGVTASVTHSFTVVATWKDDSGNTISQNLGGSSPSANALVTGSITNVIGTGVYYGSAILAINNGATAITLSTAGTFTSVTYNLSATLEQLA